MSIFIYLFLDNQLSYQRTENVVVCRDNRLARVEADFFIYMMSFVEEEMCMCMNDCRINRRLRKQNKKIRGDAQSKMLALHQ